MIVIPHLTQTYRNVLLRANTNGVTVPTFKHQLVGSGLHSYLQNKNIWMQINTMHLPKQNGSAGFGLINHKDPTTFLWTVVGGATWTANGFLSVSSGYINTNWNPSTHGGSTFTANTHSFYVWRNTNSAIGNVDFGGQAANIGVRLRTSNVSSDGDVSIMSASGEFQTGTLTTYDGGFQIIRDNSGQARFIHKGVVISTNSVATTGLPNLNMYVCAQNNAGSPGSYNTSSRVSMVITGSNNLNYETMHTAFSTLYNSNL